MELCLIQILCNDVFKETSKICSKQTLYIFKAEHHVMILSSLPNVMVDDSLAMEEGRLLDPDDKVDFGLSVAIFSQNLKFVEFQYNKFSQSLQ